MNEVGPPHSFNKAMLKRILLVILLCSCAMAADKIGTIVSAADGKQYKLVKAERKLPNGALEIAEYILVGDTTDDR